MNCSFEHNEISAYTDEKGYVYVCKGTNNVLIISFAHKQKPISYYIGKDKKNAILNGIQCDVGVNETEIDFNASSFSDTRDDFIPEVGCLIAFKKLYPSLVKHLIEELNFSKKEANTLFYVVRGFIENCPVPIFKSDIEFI